LIQRISQHAIIASAHRAGLSHRRSSKQRPCRLAGGRPVPCETRPVLQVAADLFATCYVGYRKPTAFPATGGKQTENRHRSSITDDAEKT
jgi:hypothetical protein